MIPTDMLGQPLAVGDVVARAYRLSNQAYLELRTVTDLGDDKVWLDNSNVPVTRTDRLLIHKRAEVFTLITE